MINGQPHFGADFEEGGGQLAISLMAVLGLEMVGGSDASFPGRGGQVAAGATLGATKRAA